jgi:hypothetical protein
MLTTIRRMHRMLVDRVAEMPWLRDRAGANAVWAHYEQQAKAWRRTTERHANARQAARDRADRLHTHAAERAERVAKHGPPRVFPRWQAAVARLIGQSTVHAPQERSGR